LRINESDGCVRFSVHVQPRASRDEIAGEHGDAIKIRLSAPPVDGAANAALVKFLAATFNVPRRDVMILAGESARAKVVEIRGITERTVREVITR
jgi:uncharacterized protein (TIGR00251 family)